MRSGDYSYDDFISKLRMENVLSDASYRLNRRDGLRYPSFVRVDNDGKRVHGDKFIITQNGKCCFRPPEQKVYNVISFIKTHPFLFADNKPGMSPDRLVNIVCNRLLNRPVDNSVTRTVLPRREVKPFSLSNYDIKRFDPSDRATYKPFYPYFKYRGINLATQQAFCRHFCLSTKHRKDGLSFANLSFPLVLPSAPDKTVGFEERGRPRIDGSGGYKGKAEGSDSSNGLWMANLTDLPIERADEILWFESAYDAMAAYQINPKPTVYVSTGGTPTERQMRGLLRITPDARHCLGFDSDDAGRQFTANFKKIASGTGVKDENVREYHPSGCYKDWNDALLGRKTPGLSGQNEDTAEERGAANEAHVPEERTVSFHR